MKGAGRSQLAADRAANKQPGVVAPSSFERSEEGESGSNKTDFTVGGVHRGNRGGKTKQEEKRKPRRRRVEVGVGDGRA